MAAVGDYVWYDENEDGVQDDGSANGLNGVVVTLYDSGGSPVATRTTADDVNGNPGYYLFDGLVPGDGRWASPCRSGSPSRRPGPPGRATAATLGPGQRHGPDRDLHAVQGASTTRPGMWGWRLPTGNLSWGNRVWRDTNGNGLYEAGSGNWGWMG